MKWVRDTFPKTVSIYLYTWKAQNSSYFFMHLHICTFNLRYLGGISGQDIGHGPIKINSAFGLLLSKVYVCILAEKKRKKT